MQHYISIFEKVYKCLIDKYLKNLYGILVILILISGFKNIGRIRKTIDVHCFVVGRVGQK